jgi:VWFA-related protein
MPQNFCMNGYAAGRRSRSAAFSPTLLVVLLCGLMEPSQLWPQAPAPENSAPQATTTLKVRTEVVNIYAVVRDKRRLIPNLNKEDFEVAEDGVPQEIRYFSRETDTPLTLGIMVDTSGSQQNVLPVEQEQADAFVGQVIRAKDMAFVLHFDLEVELLQDLTGDKRLLTHGIDQTVINAGGQGPTPGTFPTASIGGTHLYDAVYLAANDVLKGEIGRKVLILLTDGEDQGSRVKLDAALEAAQKSDIIFRSMGFSGDSVLKKLCGDTGGSVIRVDKPHEAAAGFQEIAEELRTQYFLGYSSSNTRHDGTFRKIQVRVHGQDYKVQARHGYYAPTQ